VEKELLDELLGCPVKVAAFGELSDGLVNKLDEKELTLDTPSGILFLLSVENSKVKG